MPFDTGWCKSVCVVVGCSGERRIGDLEVALTLEDLGPIVQPTVQLDAEQKPVSTPTMLLVIVRNHNDKSNWKPKQSYWLHTHTSSTFDNHVTLTFDLFASFSCHG